jgi:hypothetical protein
MKVGRINKSQDGRVYNTDGEIYTLNSGHYNVPKILINEPLHNTIRSGHNPDTQNRGGIL